MPSQSDVYPVSARRTTLDQALSLRTRLLADKALRTCELILSHDYSEQQQQQQQQQQNLLSQPDKYPTPSCTCALTDIVDLALKAIMCAVSLRLVGHRSIKYTRNLTIFMLRLEKERYHIRRKMRISPFASDWFEWNGEQDACIKKSTRAGMLKLVGQVLEEEFGVEKWDFAMVWSFGSRVLDF